MKCTTCGADLEPGAAFCANCGTRAPAPSSAGSPTMLITDLHEERDDQPNRPASPAYTPQPSTTPAYTPQPYAPQAFGTPAPATSTAATISLVFGILSWIALPLIGAIVAIVAGHMARREISASNNQISGAGLATAGLILGYAQVVVGLLACVGFVLLVIFGAVLSTSP